MPSDIIAVSEVGTRLFEQQEDRRTMESDEELVRQAREGRVDKFAVLVERYESLARASALNVVRDIHVASDIVQDSFIAAFESLDSLRNPGRFGSWILGILRRRAARFVREDSRRPAVLGDTVTAATPDRSNGAAQMSIELLELVNRLPDHEKVAICMRHFEGYAVADIARITGRPVGTVTKQLSRAHRRLRKWLGDEQ